MANEKKNYLSQLIIVCVSRARDEYVFGLFHCIYEVRRVGRLMIIGYNLESVGYRVRIFILNPVVYP